MKKIFLYFFMLFILNSYIHAQTNIRFAPLPMENYQIVMEQYKGLISFLEEHTKFNIEVVYEGSYQNNIKKFRNGQIDMMIVGPSTYSMLSSKCIYIKPLVQFLTKDAIDTFTCTLFSLKDKNIDLKNLQNTNIALTQETSTCGYFFTEKILRKNNSSLLKNNYKYTGSHSDSILNVLLGESELGSANTNLVNEYLDLGIKAISVSKRFPSLMLIVNTKNLSNDSIKKLSEALMLLNPNTQKNILDITKDWHQGFKYGAITIDSKKKKQIEFFLKNAGIKVD